MYRYGVNQHLIVPNFNQWNSIYGTYDCESSEAKFDVNYVNTVKLIT